MNAGRSTGQLSELQWSLLVHSCWLPVFFLYPEMHYAPSALWVSRARRFFSGGYRDRAGGRDRPAAYALEPVR